MAQLDWLDRASLHGSTKWVRNFIQSRLPQLKDQAISNEAFALALAEELEGRGLLLPERQKNYRSNVCLALKEVDPNHPAIALVSPSAEEYRRMNDAQRGKLADRETRFFSSAQAEVIVETAMGLLDSAEWSEVAAGLAVLIGRRISEILLSGFEGMSEWSLSFSEMAKKADTQGLTIEIPTLAPARTVLAAIEKLQCNLKIEDLKAASLSPKMAKQRVNGRFSEAVASQCHEHFAGLVPTRTDRETLYTHLFRAVYATIAAHWFCPPSVPEHLFKAEIQGHFTLSQEGRKLPNYSARANYDDYAIGDGHGNRDGRLGIKLGKLPGLLVIEAFRKPEVNPEAQQQQEQVEPMDITTLSDGVGVASQDGNRNALVFRATNLVAANTWAEMAIGLELLTGLRAEVLQAAVVESVSTYGLRVNGEAGETLVQQLQPTIARFQSLQPDTDQSGLQSVVDRTFGDLVNLHRDDLPQVYAAILQSRRYKAQAASATEGNKAMGMGDTGRVTREDQLGPKVTEKGKTKRSELRVRDVERMGRLMLDRGVTGSAAELFGALLDTFEESQSQQHQLQARTVEELASSLSWFTERIDSLENSCQLLQVERDQLLAERSVSEEVEALRQENQRLEGELQRCRAELEEIQSFFARRTGEGSASVPVQGAALSIGSAVSVTPAQSRAVERQPRLPQGQSLRVSRNRAETEGKIGCIVDEIIKWNSAHEDASLQLRISIPMIKPLAALMRASYQEVIQAVLLQRQAEIQGHHDQFGIGVRHNASVKGKLSILQQIAREMGLENWEEVREPG